MRARSGEAHGDEGPGCPSPCLWPRDDEIGFEPKPMTRISSPCIRLCILNETSGLGEGCGRSSSEIARWWRMSEDERLQIMAQLEARLAGQPAEAMPEPSAE